MSSFYYGLVKEINSLRKNPSAFADKLLSFKNNFKGTIFRAPGTSTSLQTMEGFKAFEEAAKNLKELKPMDDMIPSKALGKIAKDYLEKIKLCDPNDIGDIDIDLIIKKYGSFTGEFNTAMDFGSDTPEMVVVSLVVSDGDESRANREFLLNPELKKVGISTGKHMTYGNSTIIVSCTEFKNTIDKDDNEDFGGLIKKETKPETPATPIVEKVSEIKTKKEKDEVGISEQNPISCEKRERFVILRGKKKRKVILMQKYKDGHIKKEVKYLDV